MIPEIYTYMCHHVGRATVIEFYYFVIAIMKSLTAIITVPPFYKN